MRAPEATIQRLILDHSKYSSMPFDILSTVRACLFVVHLRRKNAGIVPTTEHNAVLFMAVRVHFSLLLKSCWHILPVSRSNMKHYNHVVGWKTDMTWRGKGEARGRSKVLAAGLSSSVIATMKSKPLLQVIPSILSAFHAARQN